MSDVLNEYDYQEFVINYIVSAEKFNKIFIKLCEKSDKTYIKHDLEYIHVDDNAYSMLSLSHQNNFIHITIVYNKRELKSYLRSLVCRNDVAKHKYIHFVVALNKQQIVKFMFYITQKMDTEEFYLLFPDLASHLISMNEKLNKEKVCCLYDEFCHNRPDLILFIKNMFTNIIYKSELNKFTFICEADHDHTYKNQRKQQIAHLIAYRRKHKPVDYNYVVKWSRKAKIEFSNKRNVVLPKNIEKHVNNVFSRMQYPVNSEDMLEYNCKQFFYIIYKSINDNPNNHLVFIDVIRFGNTNIVYMFGHEYDRYIAFERRHEAEIICKQTKIKLNNRIKMLTILYLMLCVILVPYIIYNNIKVIL